MELCLTMGDLEAAVRAYDQAKREAEEAKLRAATEAAEAKAQIERARIALAEAIVEAARSGMRQRDIAEVTGYTRESIRRICRAAGLEA